MPKATGRPVRPVAESASVLIAALYSTAAVRRRYEQADAVTRAKARSAAVAALIAVLEETPCPE